jgi:hypothetical protein
VAIGTDCDGRCNELTVNPRRVGVLGEYVLTALFLTVTIVTSLLMSCSSIFVLASAEVSN